MVYWSDTAYATVTAHKELWRKKKNLKNFLTEDWTLEELLNKLPAFIELSSRKLNQPGPSNPGLTPV